MTQKKLKAFYWMFKCLSVVISCALPIGAIAAKFPIWTKESGAGYSVGVGLVLIFAVVLIVFRKTVFSFVEEHLNLKHAPPLMVWLVFICISYGLIALAEVLNDLNTVFWMGFIGCAVGTLLTYISERIRAKIIDTETDKK